MGDQEVSMFHIHGYITATDGSHGHGADHAIQTIWETINTNPASSSTGNNTTTATTTTPKAKRDEKDNQCRVFVMDYTSFWKGTLTRQDWEAQRHSRCEDMVNKDLYETLTKDAFKGTPKKEGDKWELTLSVRSSNLSLNHLELTWAGSVTNTIGGRSTRQKTILGTMALEKVTPEGSKKILKQWIKTTIEERQKFEHLSDSLRGHVVSLDQQYKECKNLLVDFKLDKRRSQGDLMEKFRALINTKKEKIAKLVKSNSSLQERMEQLETALKEERRKRAVLEGKKVGDAETDPSDIMKQEGLDEDDDKKSTPLSTRGSGRGRGRGRGGGRGRGKFKAADHEYEETEEVLPQVSLPLPHPQDGYGWDEEDTGSRSKHAEGHDDDEEGDERLLRRPPRQPLMSLKRVSSSSSASAPGSGLLTAERESMRHHLDDLSAGALNLIDRVSKVAQIGQPKDIKSGGRDVLSTSSTALSTPQKPVIKREESDRARRLLHRAVERTPDRPETATIAGLQKRHRTNSNSSIVSNSSNGSSRNNSGAESGTAKNKTNVATPPEDSNSSTRSRSRYPVVSMRKARTTKMSVDKNTLDPTPHSMLKSFASTESSLPSPENNKRARLTSSPETTTSKRSAGVRVQLVKNESSIISEEDLYKELE